MNDSLRNRLRELYEGASEAAERFRYLLVGLDALLIVYVVVTSFLPRSPWIEAADLVFGIAVIAEFAARLWVSRKPWTELMHPQSLIDAVVIVSLILPLAGQNYAFLRVLRITRVLTSYRFLRQLRADIGFFRNNAAAANAGVNLFVFVFLMTALVYETQSPFNPQIKNYADALYFTVTALTTTGFGDITLQGTWGRLLSVVIMVLGVTLFLQLASTLFRARRVHWKCKECGLLEHEEDAIHCRHCGTALHRPHKG